ncbi:MAG: gamma carbonic anhydrase family protein [Firmicutes bacterium]|nr:gamma carbonic anhydrase family protein [Bacillota bacterium]
MIQKYRNFTPQIHETCFLAPGSAVIGDVIIGPYSSVWYNVVIRGDMAPIRIGANTNLQDGAILHCMSKVELRIGDNVTVGHGAILHSCSIGSGSLIGMGAIILDGVKIGENCLIAAGTLITPNKTIPAHSLVMGNPFAVKRELTNRELSKLGEPVAHYRALLREYQGEAGDERGAD